MSNSNIIEVIMNTLFIDHSNSNGTEDFQQQKWLAIMLLALWQDQELEYEVKWMPCMESFGVFCLS